MRAGLKCVGRMRLRMKTAIFILVGNISDVYSVICIMR